MESHTTVPETEYLIKTPETVILPIWIHPFKGLNQISKDLFSEYEGSIPKLTLKNKWTIIVKNYIQKYIIDKKINGRMILLLLYIIHCKLK